MGNPFSQEEESLVYNVQGSHMECFDLINLTGKDVKIYHKNEDNSVSFVSTIYADKDPCYFESTKMASEMYDDYGHAYQMQTTCHKRLVGMPAVKKILSKYIVTDDVLYFLKEDADFIGLGEPYQDGYIGFNQIT